jgi:hypothetical protein
LIPLVVNEEEIEFAQEELQRRSGGGERREKL